MAKSRLLVMFSLLLSLSLLWMLLYASGGSRPLIYNINLLDNDVPSSHTFHLPEQAV